jgi:hypothetical protein
MAKKRNKSYKPRLVLANPAEWAIAGSCLLSDAQHSQFIDPVDTAIDMIREGRASRQDWNTVANAMNVAEGLVFVGIGGNLLPAIQAATEALKAVAGRMIAGGSSTCRADELHAIREGRDMYSAQLKASTQGESSRAVQRVKQMHRSGAMEDMGKLFDRMPASREAA